jgi:hypothetical protein
VGSSARHRVFTKSKPLFLCAMALLVSACAGRVRVIEITSQLESGPGSLREAIERANGSERPVRIVSGFSEDADLRVSNELPALSGRGIEFDARGIEIVGGECTRPDGRRGCSGLVVTGVEITVRNLEVHDFLFDGVSVRGETAKDVRVVDSYLHDNQDDGVGVSNGASKVRVARCLLARNGFRTKGKGILVFDHAVATLENNVIRGNRDGVTVSKHATAKLVGNLIIDSYDKGLGVAGAEIFGRDNEIRGNGLPDPERGAAPNGDGLRVTLTSKVRLEKTRILGNGDAAVVVLNDSIVELRDATLAGNGGPAVSAGGQAVVRLIDVTWRDNAEPALRIEGDAAIHREMP